MTHPQTEAKGADAKAAAMDAVGEVFTDEYREYRAKLLSGDWTQHKADHEALRVGCEYLQERMRRP